MSDTAIRVRIQNPILTLARTVAYDRTSGITCYVRHLMVLALKRVVIHPAVGGYRISVAAQELWMYRQPMTRRAAAWENAFGLKLFHNCPSSSLMPTAADTCGTLLASMKEMTTLSFRCPIGNSIRFSNQFFVT